ncbi:MAG: hypothetical protein ACSHYF_00310 [Verrucomicrobiaceae bacterium]
MNSRNSISAIIGALMVLLALWGLFERSGWLEGADGKDEEAAEAKRVSDRSAFDELDADVSNSEAQRLLSELDEAAERWWEENRELFDYSGDTEINFKLGFKHSKDWSDAQVEAVAKYVLSSDDVGDGSGLMKGVFAQWGSRDFESALENLLGIHTFHDVGIQDDPFAEPDGPPRDLTVHPYRPLGDMAYVGIFRGEKSSKKAWEVFKKHAEEFGGYGQFARVDYEIIGDVFGRFVQDYPRLALEEFFEVGNDDRQDLMASQVVKEDGGQYDWAEILKRYSSGSNAKNTTSVSATHNLLMGRWLQEDVAAAERWWVEEAPLAYSRYSKSLEKAESKGLDLRFETDVVPLGVPAANWYLSDPRGAVNWAKGKARLGDESNVGHFVSSILRLQLRSQHSESDLPLVLSELVGAFPEKDQRGKVLESFNRSNNFHPSRYFHRDHESSSRAIEMFESMDLPEESRELLLGRVRRRLERE